MRIIIVRHGQDDARFRGGWSLHGLAEEGIEQSRLLAGYLKDNCMPVDRIISSDLPRAKETAQIIQESIPVEAEYSCQWREINNGRLAGLSNEEAEIKYPKLYFNTLKMDEKYPGGESPIEFHERIISAFKRLLNASKENVLIVTHGGVISIIIYYIKKMEWSNAKPVIRCRPAGLFEILYEHKSFQLLKDNISPW